MRVALTGQMRPQRLNSPDLEKNTGRNLKIAAFQRRLGTVLALLGLFVLLTAPVLATPQIAAAPQNLSDLSQYALPDGSIPFICINRTDGSLQDEASAPHCPLCTLCDGHSLFSQQFQLTFPPIAGSPPPSSSSRTLTTDRTSRGLGPRAPPTHI